MDTIKAFDTVRHGLLFKKLIEQRLSPVIIHFLLITYKLQEVDTKWRNEVSDFFKIGNDVKQGAVLSTVLYCVYTNDLFKELRRLNIGCCIGQSYVRIIGYNDDLFLMSPCLGGLRKMLKTCGRYTVAHNLKFNTDPNPKKSKTKCMAFFAKKKGAPWS